MDARAGAADAVPSAAKARLRRQLIAAREKLGEPGRTEQSQAVAEALRHWGPIRHLSPSSTIAAYVGVGTEPSTQAVLAALVDHGLDILLPLWRQGADLDWALYSGPDGLVPARGGLLEPQGAGLGADAIARAAVVLVPALAVDRTGNRLGRGAGAYDAALRRASPRARTCALVFSGELVDALPVENHDSPVSAVALPGGVVELRRA